MKTERTKLIAKIKVAQKQLGLDDDTYRDVLERVTGLRSAKELQERELVRVLDAFRARGWSDNNANAAYAPKSTKPHVRKIWAVWTAMCKSGYVDATDTRKALRSFVERLTGITDPEWLTAEQASKVTEALKQWQARAAKGATAKSSEGEA